MVNQNKKKDSFTIKAKQKKKKKKKKMKNVERYGKTLYIYMLLEKDPHKRGYDIKF